VTLWKMTDASNDAARIRDTAGKVVKSREEAISTRRCDVPPPPNGVLLLLPPNMPLPVLLLLLLFAPNMLVPVFALEPKPVVADKLDTVVEKPAAHVEVARAVALENKRCDLPPVFVLLLVLFAPKPPNPLDCWLLLEPKPPPPNAPLPKAMVSSMRRLRARKS
jgi:hypothetical protein